MTFPEIELIARWLIGFWLLGWLVWPLSRRCFPFLPDQGLAVGRLASLVAVSLVGFWLGALGIMPLSFAVFLGFVVPLGIARSWKDSAHRQAAQQNLRALLVSDAIFVVAFAFFLWVRLRHPEINDLEKPMDAMLLSGIARTNVLPFAHPWEANSYFTNYYYFGPLMGGLSMRALIAPTWYGYNLVQPLFCAFFLSIFWSLGAALTRSKKLGIAVAMMVCVGGHLEPFRQLQSGTTFADLDWWKTSRVVPNTINEYPAFTLLIGDAHAHFYALALAGLHICLCLGIVLVESPRIRQALIVAGGAMLAVFVLTNTWDMPLYGLLWAGSIFLASTRGKFSIPNFYAAGVGVLAIPLLAFPFFLKFHSPVHGVTFKPWAPDFSGFLAYWGLWWAMGIVAFGTIKAATTGEARFRQLLLILGIVGLLAPSIFYINGAFGNGDLAHQDTVFKFWLQAWVLIGLAVSSELLARGRTWWQEHKGLRPLVLLPALALIPIMAVAPYVVMHTRTVIYGGPKLSLNGMRYLPESDQLAIADLASQSGNLCEGLKVENGQIGGDYDPNCGRFSALTGNPAIIGWPDHVWQWGEDYGKTRELSQKVVTVYQGTAEQRRQILKDSNVRWVILGPFERSITPVQDWGSDFESKTYQGTSDGSVTVVLERKKF